MSQSSIVPLTQAPADFSATGVANSSHPVFELQTSATDFIVVLEVSFDYFLFSTSTQQAYGLGIPAAAGVGAVSQKPIFDDAGNNSNVPNILLLTAWTVYPTIPTNFLRRRSTITQGGSAQNESFPVVWKFPNGLKINPSSSLVLWEIASSGSTLGTTHNVNVVLDS